MSANKKLNKITVSSLSFFALTLANTAHAIDFDVGDTVASVYGYAKLDVVYDVDSELGARSFRGRDARLDGDPGSDGHTTISAYESRIGFRTATPLGGSTLRTVIEGDFYGGGGGDFRLRHAYGEWNGVLAGQTQTNFASNVASTPLVDMTGVTGRPTIGRHGQLRYTTGNFSAALEDPRDAGGEVDAEGAKSQLPDLTLRYTNRSSQFAYSVSSVARYLEYDLDTETESSSDSTIGWGAALEGAVDVNEVLTMRAGFAYGDGVGNYINGNPMASPAYADYNDNLESIETTTGTIGASLKVGPGSINIAYSLIKADLDDDFYANQDQNDKLENMWLNYIWSPIDRVSYGIEAGYHSRETVDNREGDALRLQGMVKYSF